MHKKAFQWVFDTVVISNFVFADSLALLEKRYTAKGVLTHEVYGELLVGIERHPELKQVDTLFPNDAFNLISLSRQEMASYQKLLLFLDLGEASTIAYAKNHNCIVVTDDRAARNQCADINIPVTGTIGILKACVQDSIIDPKQADSILDRMMAQGFCSPVRNISDIL